MLSLSKKYKSLKNKKWYENTPSWGSPLNASGFQEPVGFQVDPKKADHALTAIQLYLEKCLLILGAAYTHLGAFVGKQ